MDQRLRAWQHLQNARKATPQDSAQVLQLVAAAEHFRKVTGHEAWDRYVAVVTERAKAYERSAEAWAAKVMWDPLGAEDRERARLQGHMMMGMAKGMQEAIEVIKGLVKGEDDGEGRGTDGTGRE